MTSPTTREPVDVALLVKNWLKSDLATRFPELSVRLELPGDWAVGSDPVLLVANDGSAMGMWPVATMPTIRITSWTSGRELKYAHAALTRLLNARIPGLASVLPGTGTIETRDPQTRGDLTSFTVLTRARTQ